MDGSMRAAPGRGPPSRSSCPRTRGVRRPLAAPLAAALLLLAAGCRRSATTTDDGRHAPERVKTTRVQVVEGIGSKGGFDAAAIYDRLSPGVVTVLSLFGDEASLLDEGGEGGQGSGFVLDGDGYIATNAHVVTTGQALDRAAEVYVDFSDGNRVPARIIGHDPNADVALLKIDPAGLSLTPLELGESTRSTSATRSPRSAARSARTSPCRSGSSPHSTAHRIADRTSRSATRSRPTPRSTAATPAGPCSTPTAA